jgi:hypothetical protein
LLIFLETATPGLQKQKGPATRSPSPNNDIQMCFSDAAAIYVALADGGLCVGQKQAVDRDEQSAEQGHGLNEGKGSSLGHVGFSS